MSEIYDEQYFENGIKTGKSGYENYRWLPERIYTEIRAVISLLGINPGDKVLDFGCAKGFWVKALREYGITAFGVDSSEYAISHADRIVEDYLYRKVEDIRGIQKFDYIVSRNTFEHIEEFELEKILTQFLEMTDKVFFTVPLAQNGEYVMQMLDTTHKIRWSNEEWIRFCERCGWNKVTNFYTIKGIHDKWGTYPNSIGFYILEK